MSIIVRPYEERDLPALVSLWNEVVEDGAAFPQEELLDTDSGRAFFAAQTHCGAAVEEETGEILGLYILHPNNVGRCGHLCNASYAVKKGCRGRHIGEMLVRDCLEQAKQAGYRILQFNAVVATNLPARRLYERLGFTLLGTVPGGFCLKNGYYEDICLYYYVL